jgi:hypothetical protein
LLLRARWADIGGVTRESKREYWTKLIAEQQASGQGAVAFCREHAVAKHSFYRWLKRLREESQPVRFAVLETKPAVAAEPVAALELLLTRGERLRISRGVDVETLRLVLEALRA